MIFPGPFAGIFSNDPSLLHFSAWALPIYLAGGAIFGAQISCQQSFMSLGQAKISLILACLRKVILLALFSFNAFANSWATLGFSAMYTDFPIN